MKKRNWNTKELLATVAAWIQSLTFVTSALNAQVSIFVLHVKKKLSMSIISWKWEKPKRKIKRKKRAMDFGKLVNTCSVKWNTVGLHLNQSTKDIDTGTDIAKAKADLEMKAISWNIESTSDCSNLQLFLENVKTSENSSKNILRWNQKNFFKFTPSKITSARKNSNLKEMKWEKVSWPPFMVAPKKNLIQSSRLTLS